MECRISSLIMKIIQFQSMVAEESSHQGYNKKIKNAIKCTHYIL